MEKSFQDLEACMEKTLENEERALIAAANQEWVQEFGRNEGCLDPSVHPPVPALFLLSRVWKSGVETPQGYATSPL